MFGFLNPSLEEREWITTQNKKVWWLMPLSVAVILFVPAAFSLMHEVFWGVLITNILMRMWIHKAFVTQRFNNIAYYKVLDSISYGFILGYAAMVIVSIFLAT